MLCSLRTITPPGAPAADLELALRHARLDSDAERDLFELYCHTATSMAEKYLGRALITQTLQWSVSEVQRHDLAIPFQDTWGWTLRSIGRCTVELPYPPVQSITQVSIGQWGQGSAPLLENTDYWVDTTFDPARVRLDNSYAWGTYNSLSITYVAGYGGTTSAIPRPIVNAVMMLATNLFENRGDDSGGGMSQAVKSLLNPFRVVTYAG